MKTAKELYFEFRDKYGSDNFDTIELCNEYCKLRYNYFGSNLVILPPTNINGKYNPSFNSFD